MHREPWEHRTLGPSQRVRKVVKEEITGITGPGKILHITVVRVIAQNCKQPRCPSLEEWIYKLWYNRILQINKK